MRIKKGQAMKYRGFYCSEEIYKEMQEIAVGLNESDSEYIRKAIEMRNENYKHEPKVIIPEPKEKPKQTEKTDLSKAFRPVPKVGK